MASAQPWVVVLAGGEGTRLHSLTRALYGTDLPKQFAVLAGETSLLQSTVERAATITRWDRITVVVGTAYQEVARAQLARYPGVELIVQPRNLDTGPGILFPLVRVLARDPDARVVFLPSDHYISDPEPLLAAVRTTSRAKVTLVGVAPTAPETEYGWIVKGSRLGSSSAFGVDRFVEKPAQSVADDLFRRGGLWNTFILAGAASDFWTLAQRFLPRHAVQFERYARAVGALEEAYALEHTYSEMRRANFSADVLAHAGELGVVPVVGSGWSDWGSPQRVFQSLAGTPALDHLLARIREPREPAPALAS